MARAMAKVLLVDEPLPHVRQLTLNRPDELNTITAELCRALHGELVQTAADRSCRAVVVTGAGRGFCAGLDLRGYGAAPDNDGSDEPRDRLANQEHMSRLILQLRTLPQPVIAAVNGPAAGPFTAAITGWRSARRARISRDMCSWLARRSRGASLPSFSGAAP